ncbi:urease accessory protein UreE [Pseudoxanthobacter sp. M-2]|uniref:urease accessory protein UreE n=1 Tax=Pseudoxanthobacter sp. M-2 TaxID=3078754 RepID=UPI0038FD0335
MSDTSQSIIADTVVLDREDRHRRRMAMTGEGGLAFLLDLAEATVLADGDGLVLEDGRIVRVRAAEEDVVAITAASPAELVRIAWHLGNRHLPTELHPDRLVIRRDHVIEAMVEGLGGRLAPARAAFRPEGGAYGLGAVHGHEHGSHGHEPHGHAHSHGDHDHHHAADDGHHHHHGGHGHAHQHGGPSHTHDPVPSLAVAAELAAKAAVVPDHDDHGYCAPDEATGGRCGGGHAHGG